MPLERLPHGGHHHMVVPTIYTVSQANDKGE